jgi:hypothetical protein
VTEQQWLTSTEPGALFMWHFSGRGRLLSRKLRLFAVACCRLLWSHMRDDRSRNAVEVAERYADGAATADELKAAGRRAEVAWAPPRKWRAPASPTLEELAALTAWQVTGELAIFAGQAVLGRLQGIEVKVLKSDQCRLVREIAGNSIRPASLDPAWLHWNGGTVPKLAAAAYEERQLPEGTLDPGRLLVVADALEESGCDSPEILTHFRGPGPHVRGCWVVDLLLGKE